MLTQAGVLNRTNTVIIFDRSKEMTKTSNINNAILINIV